MRAGGESGPGPGISGGIRVAGPWSDSRACMTKKPGAPVMNENFFSLNAVYIPPDIPYEFIPSYEGNLIDRGENQIMCIYAGESVTAPLTAAASGLVTSSEGVVTMGWACNRVDCPSYGKWYCPFSW